MAANGSDFLSTAVQLNELGLTEKAVEACEQLLRQCPDHLEGRFLLGNLYSRLERHADALVAYQQALSLDPQNPVILFHLGNTFFALEKRAEAAECFRSAVHFQPDLVAAHINLGLTLFEMNDAAGGLGAMERALQVDPQNYAARCFLGNMYYRLKDFPAALEAYLQAEKLGPSPGEGQLILQIAATYRELQQFSRAVEYYRRALESDPSNPTYLTGLGSVLVEWGRGMEAVPYLERSLALHPQQPEARFYLGNAQKDAGRHRAAVESYRQAIALAPQFHAAHYNLAKVLTDLGELEQSIESYRQAIELNPQWMEAWVNLAYVLQELGNVEEALHTVEAALENAPEHVELRWNRAMLRLLLGQYREAWGDYELRWQKSGLPVPEFSRPRWKGEALCGKTLLVHCEQGLGDTLQFVRYLPLLKTRARKVVLVCQPPLYRLLAAQNLADQVVAQGDELPEFDFHIPLLSLPHLFDTSLQTIPGYAAPLVVAPEWASGWEWLSAGAQKVLRVGIVWRGNPNHTRDRDRSCSLDVWEPLTRLAQVQLYSLQKGEAEKELAAHPLRESITDLAPHLRDFADTAAAVRQMDLVISVDTSVAHLAGAMGKTVWILLPFAPDWRWLLCRSDSPWYPTARLFRQKKRGEWRGVFQRVCEALRATVTAGQRRSVTPDAANETCG